MLKSFTCADLFKYLKGYYDTKTIFRIFAKDAFGNKLEICESECTLKHLLLTNGNFFKPVYPLPHPVVYKLIFD